MTPLKLYGRPGSGSLVVQIALEELALPYERIWVPRTEAAILEFRKVNPTGKVPALVLPDGAVMFESAAMLIYLAALSPQRKLAPIAAGSDYAAFLQWILFLSANVYEAALRMYYPARYTSRGELDAEVVQQSGAAAFRAHLSFISGVLQPYVLGQAYSLADAYLYMLSTWDMQGKERLYATLPTLGEHARLIQEREAVSKVEADHAQASE